MTDAGEVAAQFALSGQGADQRQGSDAQRNRILKALKEQDLLLFLDDDFPMAPNYLEEMQRVFDENPDVVLTTGTVIADGITGPGLDHAARQALAQGLAKPAGEGMTPAHTGYGCNTAVRIGPILRHRFRDERRRLQLAGGCGFLQPIKHQAAWCDPCPCVTSGTKTGRTPGIRLGYSRSPTRST